MPVETVAVLSAVVAAFVFFGVVLARASWQTDQLLRQRAQNKA